MEQEQKEEENRDDIAFIIHSYCNLLNGCELIYINTHIDRNNANMNV